ncbi:uncharacterized protein EI90DRAFT_3130339 [Cantharellus anzutake]|uniref:uncharacterized protein n=1 Tax=Cantharellus anzutake TaxID=1750568 RepID=UPI00190754D3|nr:uncharacterized protein EI90DRAFT_3130339 [Cantharellus anzutake]KAF8323470.1 hypothetical protein EI90DRAFT_3130339 [Cantharellus anzutake]
MRARLDGPQDLSFSGLTNDHLSKLNISPAGSLELKPKSVLAELAKKTQVVGKDDIWSSENLYRHLQRLETLVPKSNEAAARAWIDAFFFRVSAMVPPDEMMVLSVEQQIPPTAVKPSSSTTLHGFIDYIAATAVKSVADKFLSDPTIERLKSMSGLVVTEAKSSSGAPTHLRDHIPQAIGEMYACAKALGKSVVRGALTVGDRWIFLIIVMNANGDGAKYWKSRGIGVLTTTPPEDTAITSPWPDVIAGILAHWMKHSFEGIKDGDDWFEVEL